jgi:hypothetical protein
MTSLSGAILAEGNESELDRAIFIVLVFHFICCPEVTDGSNEDG